ncbi:MAG TPA: porin [Gemmataceae bacterium]|nr:porin [Gemmataceae bacterium]
MFGDIWKSLRGYSLGSAALLAVANLVQAQGPALPPLPAIPPPEPAPVVRAAMLDGPVNKEAPVQQVQAQAPAVPAPALAPANPATEDKARIERLENELREMRQLLQNLQTKPASAPAVEQPVAQPAGQSLSQQDVRSLINSYMAEKEAAKRAEDLAKQQQGFVVGKNLEMSGRWTTNPGSTGNQPWLETADKAYRVHWGFRFHPDWIFGDGATKGVETGKGGTGPFRESFDLRRARLEADGWVGEVIDFMIEFDFVQQFSTGAPYITTVNGKTVLASPATVGNTINPVSPTDVYAGINHIPILGGFRIGNFKFPLGLDHLTSSRFLDFMERSSGFDIYYNRANGFEPGFMIWNNTENQKLTWQIAATKPDNSLFDVSVGGGQWRYSGRLTGLPYYEDNGRRMVHLGVGACYIDNLDQGFSNQVGRWLLRNGGNALQNVVGLAQVFGDSQAIVNPEFFMNMGPLSIQSEYIFSQVNGVTSYNTNMTGGVPVPVSSRPFQSQTAYIQAMYFLTGENRPYGMTALHGSGAAPTRVVPYRNYFWVPGSGNGNPFSSGAWQVGVRYCYSDLSNNGINGGIINEVTFGLNWFLNPNMKIQWNYDIGHREIAGGSSDGNYYGFGMRMAFDF